jgi:hypothetical protein
MWAHEDLPAVLADHMQWGEVRVRGWGPRSIYTHAWTHYTHTHTCHTHALHTHHTRITHALHPPQATRLVRHMELQAKAEANMEVAWLAAEASERKAREAAGAAAYDDAASRAKRKMRPMVRNRLGSVGGHCFWPGVDTRSR